MTIEQIRSLFPYLETGAIYFNHAAVSPLSTPVVAAMQEHLAMRSTGAIDDYNKILRTFATARARTAELINAESDRIAFAENTSTGLNILAQGLQWKHGDEIILNSIEFPSNVYPFLNLKSQGVNIEFVKAHDGIVSAEDIIAAVTPRTKLISISFVQFLTGYRADMQMLGEYCRAHNIIFCVDAIQGLGALRLDVKKCCIDYVSCGTQKWLMSEPGLAFVYLTSELQERLKPAFVGWLSVNNAWDLLNFDLSLKKDATALQTGTTNNIVIAAFAAALGVMDQIPAAEREQIVLDNSEYFIGKLQEAGYKPILAGIDRKYLSGIVSFPHEDAQAVFVKLTKANITCSLRQGIIRFSPHFYNVRDEIDKAILSLKN
jgi:cysteine desulfurase / selenocysteine lyase